MIEGSFVGTVLHTYIYHGHCARLPCGLEFNETRFSRIHSLFANVASVEPRLYSLVTHPPLVGDDQHCSFGQIYFHLKSN